MSTAADLGTVRSDARLADGRAIYYYSHGAARGHRPDLRDLPVTEPASQLRHDALFGTWTVVAGHRQARTYKPPAGECPLCPSRDGRHTEIPDDDYEVVVFENRFPSLASSGGDAVEVPADPGARFESWPARGRCEVVCFTSGHDGAFAALTTAQARLVVDAWADRSAHLAALPGVRSVFCFENRGDEIGVTLAHPHGQIYAYPYVPPRFADAQRQAEAHHARTGECLQCTLLAAERAGSRLVARSRCWTAYVPFAARWPYEVRIVPDRHVGDLPGLTPDERDDLASIYLDVLGRFDRLFGAAGPTPYIAGWQQRPASARAEAWHLAAEVFTVRRARNKLKYLAGSESGAAAWMNDVPPETAAARLRDAG